MMFGSIIVSGVSMMSACRLDLPRNMLIAAGSLSIGIGVTQVDGFFSHMPAIVGDIFAGNPVAGVFVVSLLMSILLPKNASPESVGSLTPEDLKDFEDTADN